MPGASQDLKRHLPGQGLTPLAMLLSPDVLGQRTVLGLLPRLLASPLLPDPPVLQALGSSSPPCSADAFSVGSCPVQGFNAI